jgi:putative YphP/YqiW family bacilliredoxin
MRYDPELVAPMRQEMVDMGAQELLTAEQVDAYLGEGTDGTTLLFINSVCGCAAGSARPGLRMALQNENRPDRICTVFAGQDGDATERARSHFGDLPPSSPSLAIFRGGEVVHFVPRHMIEGRDAPSVAFDFVTAFDEHCSVQ